MSNRHQRRAEAARCRANRQRHDTLFTAYIRHLPQVPLDAPLEPGRVYHVCFHHDPDCGFYLHQRLEDCTCSKLVVTRHVEPRRA